MEWLYANETPLLEIVVRVVVIYCGLLFLLRLPAQRELGQISSLDLLGILLLSETVSPVLTDEDGSVVAGLTAAATLILLMSVVGRLTFHSRRAEQWIDGEPVLLVANGRLVEDAARSQRITRQELESALRRGGVESVAQVRCAFVEPNGEISVIKRESKGAG